ncbi:MAG: recombinase family protein [Desulfovibrionaceae bacterium]|nr:recombinase family protein [Desulfovibrionaceae bacterium]
MDIGYIRTSPAIKNNPQQLIGVHVHRTYADSCSLKDEIKPEKAKMLNEIHAGDIIHVQSADRIAIDLTELSSFMETLGKKGVGLVLHNEGIHIPADPNNPTHQNALQSLRTLSHTEKTTTKERMDHLRHARRSCGRVGRPSSVTQEQKEAVKKLLMTDPQMSISQISRETGVPKTTCFRIKAMITEEMQRFGEDEI